MAMLGGAAMARPCRARAQGAEPMRRVGVLIGETDDTVFWPYLAGFGERLRALGWTEDGNVAIDSRWGHGDPTQLHTYAAALVEAEPDVILVQGRLALSAVQQATHTIPVVFVMVADPVGAGFVPNLAHPGGDITGVTHFNHALGSQWLEVLKQIAPGIARVSVLMAAGDPDHAGYFRAIEARAPLLGVTAAAASYRDRADFVRVVGGIKHQTADALILAPHMIANANHDLVVAAAARQRLPAIYPFRLFAIEKGLISYGAAVGETFRLAAGYVNRILRGVKPAALPVLPPSKPELVINLKTANALGLAVPPALHARADEVID
jgi:putative tryptophan/tyrosine transport system substrate-binding protein